MAFTPDCKRGHKTAGGLPARIIATDLKGEYPIAAAITNARGIENVNKYTADGRYYHDGTTDYDLMDIDPVVTRKYHPICVGQQPYLTAGFPTLDDLLETARETFVADVWGALCFVYEDGKLINVTHVANAEDTKHLRRT